jgi:hypothetical protein
MVAGRAAEDDPSVTLGWLLVGVAALGAVSAAVRARGRRLSQNERSRILEAAVSDRIADGWIVESAGPSDAVIRRGSERTVVLVDGRGRVRATPAVPAGN